MCVFVCAVSVYVHKLGHTVCLHTLVMKFHRTSMLDIKNS